MKTPSKLGTHPNCFGNRNIQMLINVLQSQIAWFAAVLSAAGGRPWLGTTVALALTAIHIARAADNRKELTLVLAAGTIGALGDSVLAAVGLVTFTSGTLLVGVAPPWMIALWMNFATVLNGALRSLRGHTMSASAVGAVAGPLAYAAGARLGALEFTTPKLTVGCIALEWAIALPILCALASRAGGSSLSASTR